MLRAVQRGQLRGVRRRGVRREGGEARAQAREDRSVPVRGEAVAVDERVVVGEVEDAGFGVSGLYGMGRWNAQGEEAERGRTYLGFWRDAANLYPAKSEAE